LLPSQLTTTGCWAWRAGAPFRKGLGQGMKSRYSRNAVSFVLVALIWTLTARGEDYPKPVASQEVPEYVWEQVTAKAPFAPRDGAGALTFQGRMWFLGGWNPGD